MFTQISVVINFTSDKRFGLLYLCGFKHVISTEFIRDFSLLLHCAVPCRSFINVEISGKNVMNGEWARSWGKTAVEYFGALSRYSESHKKQCTVTTTAIM
jgi:hypothetical protein